MEFIKLIACDIDGVLLKDTFSPVLYHLAGKNGVEYTREDERNIFSRSRQEVFGYIQKKYSYQGDLQKSIKDFTEARDAYVSSVSGSSGLIDGVLEALELLSSANVKLVCYGGLSENQILDEFKQKCMHYFDKYICTNDFRPGIKEITKDIYGLEFNQALFIDDVNTVAENAKLHNVPFIGIPADFPWSFQKKDMMETGVKYILNSIKELNPQLLQKMDEDAKLNKFWK